MVDEWYAHRFADIILSSDYELKQEIDQVIGTIKLDDVRERFAAENAKRGASGRKEMRGKQIMVSRMFHEEFIERGWEAKKNVFNDPDRELVIDYFKRSVGVYVALGHRFLIGNHLMRFQAASEIRDIIKVGVYICLTEAFANVLCPDQASRMVSFERVKWYLNNFNAILTVPILLIGLRK